jgi:hypothetical protein
MALMAVAVLVYTQGKVQILIVMYSINVFMTFTLSQLGMVRHWWQMRAEGGHWRRRMIVAMTGEITLRGNVLPVGGIKEKVLAAQRAGVKKMIMPAANKKDLHEIPKKVIRDIEFIFVEDVKEVFREAMVGGFKSAPAKRAAGTPAGKKRAAKPAKKA